MIAGLERVQTHIAVDARFGNFDGTGEQEIKVIADLLIGEEGSMSGVFCLAQRRGECGEFTRGERAEKGKLAEYSRADCHRQLRRRAPAPPISGYNNSPGVSMFLRENRNGAVRS